MYDSAENRYSYTIRAKKQILSFLEDNVKKTPYLWEMWRTFEKEDIGEETFSEDKFIYCLKDSLRNEWLFCQINPLRIKKEIHPIPFFSKYAFKIYYYKSFILMWQNLLKRNF